MTGSETRERRLAYALMAPALGAVLLVAIFPLVSTLWESLHAHDLRMPWLGRPFVGGANYVTLASDPRFWDAVAHTTFFTVSTVTLELGRGRARARGLGAQRRGRAAPHRTGERGTGQGPSAGHVAGEHEAVARTVHEGSA